MPLTLIGLGNPGEKYCKNRHNAGFLFLDYIYANSTTIKKWFFDKYLKAEVSHIILQGSSKSLELTLLKPQTFMNLSGFSVSKLLEKNKDLTIDDLCIIHDDLDFLLGQYKLCTLKGPKKHNGLISIEDALKSSDFTRIRIGVENRKSTAVSGEDFLLADFDRSEQDKLNDTIFPAIFNQLKDSL